MRKAIAIFFLFFFCLSQAGHYVLYAVQRWRIQEMVREEILAGIPDRYLEKIEQTNAIEWEEEGREFSIEGEFFDVVKTKNINGKVFLFCVNDKTEEHLVKDFAKTIRSAAENEKGKNNKHSFKFHLLDEIRTQLVSAAPFINKLSSRYYNYTASIISLSREVIMPPPWKGLQTTY